MTRTSKVKNRNVDGEKEIFDTTVGREDDTSSGLV
jgi:hypothetical protein